MRWYRRTRLRPAMLNCPATFRASFRLRAGVLPSTTAELSLAHVLWRACLVQPTRSTLSKTWVVSSCLCTHFSRSHVHRVVYLQDIQTSQGVSSEFVGLLNGIGVAGLFVSILAGAISDRAGTVWAGAVGGALLVTSYLLFSISHSVPALLVTYTLVGVGSGSTYQAALQTAVVLGRDFGVGLVAVCMSFSINLTVDLHDYLSAHHCDDSTQATCWRWYVRVYAVIIACFVTIGCTLMIGYRKHVPQSTGTPADSQDDFKHDSDAVSTSRLLSARESLIVFKQPYFWTLFLSNLVALGSAIFVVSCLFGDNGIWNDFHRNSPARVSANTVLLLFSIFNAGALEVAACADFAVIFHCYLRCRCC